MDDMHWCSECERFYADAPVHYLCEECWNGPATYINDSAQYLISSKNLTFFHFVRMLYKLKNHQCQYVSMDDTDKRMQCLEGRELTDFRQVFGEFTPAELAYLFRKSFNIEPEQIAAARSLYDQMVDRAFVMKSR